MHLCSPHGASNGDVLIVQLQVAKWPSGEPAALQAQSLPLQPPRQQGSLYEKSYTLDSEYKLVVRRNLVHLLACPASPLSGRAPCLPRDSWSLVQPLEPDSLLMVPRAACASLCRACVLTCLRCHRWRWRRKGTARGCACPQRCPGGCCCTGAWRAGRTTRAAGACPAPAHGLRAPSGTRIEPFRRPGSTPLGSVLHDTLVQLPSVSWRCAERSCSTYSDVSKRDTYMIAAVRMHGHHNDAEPTAAQQPLAVQED